MSRNPIAPERSSSTALKAVMVRGTSIRRSSTLRAVTTISSSWPPSPVAVVVPGCWAAAAPAQKRDNVAVSAPRLPELMSCSP